MTETKKCRICGEELPLEAFNRDRKERDGHSRWCRSCQKEYKVNSYAKEACTEGPFTCQNCGEEFDIKRSDLQRRILSGKYPPKYCSPECYTEFRRRMALSKEGPFTCQNCGEEFYVTSPSVKSRISSGDYTQKFCSHECYHASRGSATPSRKMGVCRILSTHHNILKDDPDRLSTDFLKSLIGGAASNCEGSE